jgi:glycosyltransferase involved in cell wall biosynthesis
MNRLKVAWIYPSIVFGAYWKPVIERFQKLYPDSVFFTGCVWPGFDPQDPACAAFQIVGKTRYVAARDAGSGYKRAFILASPAVLFPLIRFAPKVVFSSAFSVWTILALLAKPFTRWRVAIMYDGSSPNSDFRDSRVRTWMRQILAYFTDAFVANSDAGKDYMMEVLGVPEKKIFRETYLVPDASELNVECSEENRQKIEALSAGLEGPVFLFVGQLIERKGIRTLIEAVRRIKESGQEKFTILIIGDGEKRLEFVSLARGYGVEAHFRWMGWIQYRQLGAYFERSDVFVFPTFEDCWGMAVLEAMRFGKPVLCSTGANACELVHEGRNGYLFPPDDAEALAQGMIKFIAAPELAAVMGAESTEIIRAYHPESAAQGFASVVAALAGDPVREEVLSGMKCLPKA